jgi:hypothetical protein
MEEHEIIELCEKVLILHVNSFFAVLDCLKPLTGEIPKQIIPEDINLAQEALQKIKEYKTGEKNE